jgi:hypothetical protein
MPPGGGSLVDVLVGVEVGDPDGGDAPESRPSSPIVLVSEPMVDPSAHDAAHPAIHPRSPTRTKKENFCTEAAMVAEA